MLPRRLRYVAHVCTLALLYFAAAQLGGALGADSGVASVVWPSAGVAMAMLLQSHHERAWPGVLMGAWLTNLHGGMPWLSGGIVAVGCTVSAWLGSMALRRVGVQQRFDRLQDVYALALFGALGSTLFSASCGAITLLVTRSVQQPSLVWLAWWLGDAMGILVVVPAWLIWSQGLPAVGTVRRRVEGVTLSLLLGVVNAVIFLRPAVHDALRPPAIYLLFPVLLWAAARFGQRGAASAACATAMVAVVGTANDLGPFAGAERVARLMSLQLFLGIVVLSILILGAVLEERRKAILVREEFLMIASHELKTPLTALQLSLGNLQRIIHRGLPADAALRKLAVSQQQVTRLIHLTHELLDVTQLNDANVSLRRQACDLSDITAKVLQRLEIQSHQAKCVLRADLSPACGYWDADRLEQVVSSLTANAIKYGAGNPIVISVQSHANLARLQVQDRGIGIASQDLERIFERFGRAVSIRNYGGLGLALHMAKRIIRAHGGIIYATSQPGEGACFTVDLPATTAGTIPAHGSLLS